MPVLIGYETGKLEKICLDSAAARKALPQDAARKLHQRLAELAAFDSLGDPPGGPLHFHALSGDMPGHFSIRIDKKHRIVFRPAGTFEEPTPGMPNLATVTEVIVTYVGDYHD